METPTEDEFNTYFKNMDIAGFHKSIKQIKLEKNDFLSTLRNEIPNILKNLENLNNSNAPKNFKEYITNCIDYGCQSALWYYKMSIDEAISSLACAAPETYEETTYKYLVAREWLVRFETDRMIKVL